MNSTLLTWVVYLGFLVLAAGMVLCVLRIVRGPHLADRAVGADTLGVHLIGMVILLSLRFDTLMLIDGVLLLSLLGFAGTVAMAQYIARPHLSRRDQESAPAPEAKPPAPGVGSGADGRTQGASRG